MSTIPSINNFYIEPKTFGDVSFQIQQPDSSSNGLFSYLTSDPLVADISGDFIIITGAGSANITAIQQASGSYTSGTATTLFQVNKAIPSFTSIFSIPPATYGDPSFVIQKPVSNSDGSFNYFSSNSTVADISGDTIIILGTGTTSIIATQLATANYTSRTISASFQVNKANPNIRNFSIPPATYGDGSVVINAPETDSSGSFIYSTSNSSVASISGNKITIVSVGTATITATQLESTYYTSGTITTSFQVNKATPTIPTFSIPPATYGDGSFVINPPASNSDGSFNYTSSNTSVADISGNTIIILSPGSTTITASQSETSLYAYTTKTALFQVNKATPSISSFSIPPATYGDIPFVIDISGSNSDGSFNYSSSNPSVADISGNTIVIFNAGTTIITAIQSETPFYNSKTLTTLFEVNKATPSVPTFSLPPATFGDPPFTIDISGSSSDGSFSYISTDTTVADICGNTITILSPGTTTIIATQQSTTNYTSQTITATLQVNEENEVIKLTPTLGGFSIEPKTYLDAPFQIQQPQSTSDGSFSYISSDPFVADISGDFIIITGIGSTTITAIQETTPTYDSKTISAILQVNKPTPDISNFSIDPKTFGDSSFQIQQPDSSSNGVFSYSTSNSSVADISGDFIIITGAGTATITATQLATQTYNFGTITTSFQVNKATPSISTFSIPSKIFGDIPFEIQQPESNSTGSFSYASSEHLVATISGDIITIVGAGTTTITATQEETSNYISSSISASFQVNKAAPSIPSFSIPSKVFGDLPFTIDISGSNSDGSFNYTSSVPSVADISGNTITIFSTGNTNITATQAETTNYTSGTIIVPFQVNKATPSIPSFSIPSKTFGDIPFTIDISGSTSDGSFNYTSSDTSVADISGNTITIISPGTTIITAIQTETINYTSGIITTSFLVNKATPLFTSNFFIPPKTVTDSPFTINPPTSTSDGSFSFISSNTSVANISGNTITIVSGGNTIITATQAETKNYTSATIKTAFQVIQLLPNGEICFLAGTPISTNQGLIPIEQINPNIHTIRNKPIVGITKSISGYDKYLVCFEKDCLGNNIPSQKTIISKNHKIFYNGKMIKADELVGLNDKIKKLKYRGEILYNVLMENHDKMLVNNLICETLDPSCDIAKLYKCFQFLNIEQKNKLIELYNSEYKKHYNILRRKS
jgi:hypothetical protein